MIGYSGDAAAASARAFLSTVTTTAATAAAVDAAVASAVAAKTAVAGQTFTLTTSVDTKTGTAGADVFDAGLANSASDGDNLSGGTGVDRLNARYAADGNHAPDMDSVEEIYVRFDASTTADVTFDLNNAGAVTLAVADRINAGATGGLTFDNMSLTTAAGIYKGNGSGPVTFTYLAVSGTADASTLALMDADVGTVTISSVETLSITGTVGSSVVDSLAASSARTISINASEAVTITAMDNYEDASITITGSGNVTVGLDDAKTVAAASATGNITLTGIDETESYNIVTGSGNDIFSSFGTALAAADIITANGGTDRLIVNYDITDGIIDGVTGIEEFEYQMQGAATAGQDSNLDMDAFNGQSVSLIYNQASATGGFDDISVTNFVSGTTITINAEIVAATGVLTLTADTDADASAILVLKAADADGVDIAETNNDFNEIASLTVNSILDSTVTMSSTAESSLYVGSGSDDLDLITITGSANLQLTAAETEVDIIEAGSFTGKLTLGVAGAASLVTINSGSGADLITISASTEATVNAGSGADTIAFGTTLNDNDVVNGGDGTDTLTFTVAAYNDDLRLTSIEAITVTDSSTGASTIDLNGLAGMTTINFVAVGGTAATDNAVTFDDVGASLTTLILDSSHSTAGDSVVIDLATDTSADVITIRVDMDDSNFVDNVTADDFETVTVNFAYGSTTTGGTAAADLGTLDFDDATLVSFTNTRLDGVAASTYVGTNLLTSVTLDTKTNATIDLTGWSFDVGVDSLYTSAMTTTVADSATATAVTAGDFGTAGLTLTGADALTIKLEDGETSSDSVMYISLGSSNAGIDTIQFTDNSDDATNDIGAVILANFLAAGANSVTNRTKIDLTAYGVTSLSDLTILDGAQAANGTSAGGDVTFIFASGTKFAGNIQLVGVDASLITADNFIFTS